MKFARTCVAIAAFLGLAGAASAECTPIAEPAANAGMEQVKSLLQNGDYQKAVAGFELSNENKAELAARIQILLGGGEGTCTTIRRSRQSDNWISELLAIRTETNLAFFVLAGPTNGDDFTLYHFRMTPNAEEIRDLFF